MQGGVRIVFPHWFPRSPLVLKTSGHIEQLLLVLAKRFHLINNILCYGKDRHHASVNLFSRFERHEVVSSQNIAGAQYNCSNRATLHGVGDLLLDVELDVLSKFIFQVVVIDVWKIVYEITR